MSNTTKGRHRKVASKKTVAGRISGILAGLGLGLTVPIGQGVADAEPESRGAWYQSTPHGSSGSSAVPYGQSVSLPSSPVADRALVLAGDAAVGEGPKGARSVAEDAAKFFASIGYSPDGAGPQMPGAAATSRDLRGSPIDERVLDAILFGGIRVF